MSKPGQPLDLKSDQLARLRQLLACPTAPFFEHRVLAWAAASLEQANVPCCSDRHGNLVVGASSLVDYRRRLRRRGQPLVVMIAHTDHPGFHGQRWLAPDRLAVRWHGGGPRRHLAGARVWLSDGCNSYEGALHRPQLSRDGLRVATAEESIGGLPDRRPGARSLYGGLAFRDTSWLSGHRLYTRAADDLVGVFAIVETACRSTAERRSAGLPDLFGLLTRGEEVGFVGALAHFDDGWLQDARRPLVCVSLEASSSRPGARYGHGPVVRLGDRQSAFTPEASQRLTRVAAATLAGRHQRKLMDGGVCEATAALACGLAATGIAVPLGNYHNQNLDGGLDAGRSGGPAPEFVDRRDVAGLLALCQALGATPWDDDPWRPLKTRLTVQRDKYRSLLARRPADRQDGR